MCACVHVWVGGGRGATDKTLDKTKIQFGLFHSSFIDSLIRFCTCCLQLGAYRSIVFGKLSQFIPLYI